MGCMIMSLDTHPECNENATQGQRGSTKPRRLLQRSVVYDWRMAQLLTPNRRK
jgi:hypothetical protein